MLFTLTSAFQNRANRRVTVSTNRKEAKGNSLSDAKRAELIKYSYKIDGIKSS
jgi:hypothetical protein